MKYSKSLLALALSLVALGAQASTNLVTNGSFEDNIQGPNSWKIYDSLNGWTANPVLGIELRNDIAGKAQQGVNYVELDTTANSSIQQTINSTGWVNLSFWYSARPNTGATNDLTFSFGNVSGTVLSGVSNSTDIHNWQHYTQLVNLGTSGSSALTFSAAGPSDSFGGSLDNISVTAVPEPETYALLLAGLGLMGAISRRRNKANKKA